MIYPNPLNPKQYIESIRVSLSVNSQEAAILYRFPSYLTGRSLTWSELKIRSIPLELSTPAFLTRVGNLKHASSLLVLWYLKFRHLTCGSPTAIN